MIEIAFNESLGGALKIAKSMKPGQRMACSIGVIGAGKLLKPLNKPPRRWAGAAMDGSSREVEALTLSLDIGDIADCPGSMQSREQLLQELYGEFPGVPEGMQRTNQHALERIREHCAAREPVRAWICERSPAELCGICFLCALTKEAQIPLSVVYVPGVSEADGCLKSRRSSGDAGPQELGALAAGAVPLSAGMRACYAGLWPRLQQENAPLRAVVNGALISVPIDFYDFLLRAHLPAGEFRAALLIGAALNHMPGVSDRWLFLRIQAMLRAGELTELSPASDDHPYSALLRRA